MTQRSARESEKPFFSRARTKSAIRHLAYPTKYRPIVIYAGAGATIDRSGLDWRAMIDGLLELHIPEPEKRETLFANQSELEVGTLARRLYRQTYADEHEARLIDQLKLRLYGPSQWRAGLLLTALGDLASAWRSKRHVIFVTPNYDDYLLRELEQRFSSNLRVIAPSEDEQGSFVWEFRGSGSRRGRKKAPSELTFPPSKVTLVQLHGLVESSASAAVHWSPVIDELDYILSADRSAIALSHLFVDSDILMVGTSLRDQPLLRALHARNVESAEGDCVAIATVGMNLQSSSDELRDVRKAALLRSQAFGVQPIYVDFYVQIAQLVFELARAVEEAAGRTWDALSAVPNSLPSGLYNVRSLDDDSYGRRLDIWADKWRNFAAATGPDYGIFYAILETLNICKENIDVSTAEHLKLEFWVREQPSSRNLRLWTSSAVYQFDDASARRSAIDPSSRIVAVRAFTSGGPLSHGLDPELHPHQRWRTYLATPVWLPENSTFGRLPVGCLVLASMRHPEESALNQDANSTVIAEQLQFILKVGGLIAMGHDGEAELTELLGIETGIYNP